MNLGIRKSYEGLPPNIEVWDQLLYFSLISLVLYALSFDLFLGVLITFVFCSSVLYQLICSCCHHSCLFSFFFIIILQ